MRRAAMTQRDVPVLEPIVPHVKRVLEAFLQNLSRAGFPFQSADIAAITALDEIYYKSVANNWEFAGRIFKRSGKYFYTSPRTLKSSRESDPGLKLPNVENIGTYHSHAGQFLPTDELFSPKDKLKAELGKDVSYVITPRGKIMKYIPISLSPPGTKPPGSLGHEEVLRQGLGGGASKFGFHQQLFSPRELQKYGDRGDTIKVVQMLLNKRPPSALALLVPDGIFGAKTLARVTEFQTLHQLARDGIVGPLTRRSLFKMG
jgi:peptidoglycan hydrolase-like protein with peptidoglycan-binding domain